MMNDKYQSDIPIWEASKENVLPLKRGRSVKGLSQALALPSVQGSDEKELSLDTQEKRFEDIIQDIRKTNDMKSLLEQYLLYFKWIRDAFPSNSEKALKLLERCTLELKDESDLKNDIRFVKFWIEYADMVRTPNDVFSFMNSNKIGDKVALYWIAWAFVAEKSENFKLTDQIFQKGIRHLAEPRDILQKRYQQFQRRLARHYINLKESNDGQFPSQSDGRAPLMRINDENSSQVSTRRTAEVGALSQRTASTMNQPKRNHGLPQSAIGHSNKTFQVFNETISSADPLAENPLWRNLGTEKERRRENEVPATMWSDGPLMAGNKSTQEFARTEAKIPIFVDEQYMSNERSKTEDDQVGSKDLKPALSVRKNLDGDIDRINKDPLARHKGTCGNIKDSEETKCSKHGEIKPIENDAAISTLGPTGVAMKSEKAVGIEREITFPKQRESKQFKDCKFMANENNTTQKTSTFQIFSDNKNVHDLNLNQQVMTEKQSMKLDTKIKTGKFTEEIPSIPASSSHKFAIYSDGNRELKHKYAMDTTKNHDISVTFDIHDSDEDGRTINTRIARKDIDSMFCSPEMSPVVTETCLKKKTMSDRRPFIASNFESITGLQSDLSAIHENSKEDHSIFGSINTPTAFSSRQGRR